MKRLRPPAPPTGVLFAAPLLVAACAKPGDTSGRLTDALTRAPLAGVEVVATPDAPTDACPAVTTATDADGAFTLAALCRAVRYDVAPDRAAWWLDAPLEVDGGVALTGLDRAAWPLPPEDGVFLLTRPAAGPALATRLVSQAAIDEVTPIGGAPVRIPTLVPATLPVVGDGWLVVSQRASASPVRLHPLVPTERMTVGPDAAPRTLDPWVALGPALDPTPGAVVAGDGASAARVLRVLDADAAPAGDYAVADADGRRAILVRFGDEPDAAPPSPAP